MAEIWWRSENSVAKWPKFRPRSSKGPRKNIVGRKNLWTNFGRILPKVAKKGPKNIFFRSSLFNGTDTLSETKKNFNFISNWPLECMLHWRVFEIGRIFLMYQPENNFGTWQHCRRKVEVSHLPSTIKWIQRPRVNWKNGNGFLFYSVLCKFPSDKFCSFVSVCLAVPRVVSEVFDLLVDTATIEVLVHRHLETGKGKLYLLRHQLICITSS